jgi:hypothetical protein
MTGRRGGAKRRLAAGLLPMTANRGSLAESNPAMKPAFCLIAAIANLIALTGCDTFEHRAKEKAASFAALDQPARAKLERGVIEVGNTPDMVYIALGAPDEKIGTTTRRGTEQTWIFNRYFQEFAGNVQTGYRRVVIYHPATKSYTTYYDPIYSDVFVDRTEECIRITFRDGKVTAIEEPKDP